MAEASGKPSTLPEWALDLTAKQLRFVEEYIIDMDARKAALRSGMAETVREAVHLSGSIMRNEEVRQALDLFFAEGLESRKLLRNRIIEELSALSFYETGDFLQIRKNTLYITDTDQLTPHQMKALKRVKQTKGKSPAFEIEFHDKVKAMELLDRMTGGGGPAVQINNQQNNAFVLEITEDELGVCGFEPGKGPQKRGATVEHEGNGKVTEQ